MPVELPTGTKEVEDRHRFDEARLEEYLKRELDGFTGPLSVRQFRGGQSNPTYQLSDPNGMWVLRRKPPGELLKSAHAVDREFRVISALNSVDFPVPRAGLLCTDESLIGTMFFVMEYVEGRVIWDTLLTDWKPDERRSLYATQIEILARLHTTDYEAIGLGDYGRPGNYYARQVNRWTKQYRASETESIPDMERLIEWMPKNIPEDDSSCLSHGDYNLNNMLVHPTEPRIIAILDWELSTIGHPMGDLTYHLSLRRSPNRGWGDISNDELRAMGIPTQDDYIARYCELTGRDGIPDLDFYLAFNYFRSAGIMQGIAGRIRDGTAAGEGAEEVAKTVRPLAALSMEYAAKLGA